MIQSCEVFFNIDTWSDETIVVRDYLKEYFKDKKNWKFYDQTISSVDIDYDHDESYLTLDIDVDIECEYIGGSAGSRWEPPEPSCIEGYYTEDDFVEWLENILRQFEVIITIDEESTIPTEDELIKDFEEEAAKDYYNDEF